MRSPFKAGLLCLCLCLASFVQASEHPFDLDNVTGVATVHEAGLIEVSGLTLRLDGIRALSPGEMCAADPAWNCGDYARDLLAAFIADKPVRCRLKQRVDAVWRARCSLDRVDLQAFLVTRGLAVDEGQGMYADLTQRSALIGGPIHLQLSSCTGCL